MQRRNLERHLAYREHFFAMCVIGLECANTLSGWM